jgi:hypothetical protein
LAADASATDGCRLRDDGEGYAPSCFRAGDSAGADRRGIDGVTCKTGADCAPGFDCVDGEKGSVCRRYCCMGTCEGQSSLNGGPTFCDVQKLVDPAPHLAPVCMPIKTCKLLVEGDCGPKETCAIVTEKGVTGCVPRGSAKAGDSCDEEHCSVGLTCLGIPGNRRCYKLCRMEGAGADYCPPTQTCVTASLFQDNTVGVCKEN